MSELRPVSERERIELLDVLRGFALCGVLYANLTMTASVYLSPEDASLPTDLDGIARQLRTFFVKGKLYATFGFLFGLGLNLQMERAAERGVSADATCRRRLGWLLVFGLGHTFLLWWGDILVYYALVGFVLLAFRICRDRTLLVSGVLLVVVPHVFSAMLAARRAHPEPASDSAAAESLAERVATAREGGYFDLLRDNFALWRERTTPDVFVFICLISLGFLLIGTWAGRGRYLQDAASNQAVFRRVLAWGLLAGVVGNGLFVVFPSIPSTSPWYVPSVAVIRIGVAALAAVYVAAIALSFQKPAGRRLLAWLAPVGRMALTSYLMHSVFFVFVFSGFGLGWAGAVSYAGCVPIAAAIFALQAVFCRVWLRFFRFGPAEWLWRSLTYGKRQRFLAAD